MIRGTKNEGISCVTKQVADPTANPGIAGESYETVIAGIDEANAVITEKRDIDARSAFQTTTPSDGFNGTYE